jgi:hypothetical protein
MPLDLSIILLYYLGVASNNIFTWFIVISYIINFVRIICHLLGDWSQSIIPKFLRLEVDFHLYCSFIKLITYFSFHVLHISGFNLFIWWL